VTKTKSLLAVWRDAVRDSDMSWRAKIVAHTITTYMNVEGAAFPSRATIARGASISLRTVDAGLQELEKRGFLSVAVRCVR
jgi:DNA-binding transcriptional regulator YhcF (GntR family)